MGHEMNTTTGLQKSITARDLFRDIKAAMAEIETRAPTVERNQQLTMLGEPVFQNPHLDSMPKMQLTKKVYDNLPSPFRDEINAWMRDFFGTESRMYQVPGVGVFMGPKAVADAKASLAIWRF